MPSVTITPESPEGLLKEGPRLEVRFLISSGLEDKYKAEGKPLPEPVVVNALIDTGASVSVIQKSIPEKLGLTPVGVTNICTPSSKDHQCYQYFMRMHIPTHQLTYEGIFIGAPLDGQNISCLIGRDILKDGMLIYIGVSNLFTFSLL